MLTTELQWLVGRRGWAPQDAAARNDQAYGLYQPGGQPMYSMPPPVYDPNRPPGYEVDGSKIDPTQARNVTRREPEADPAPDYTPPPGPPPAVLR